MLVKDTSLIAITSPSDESTQMGSQIHAKIRGTDKFVWKLISPDKCAWCIRNPDMSGEEGCPHVVVNLPAFRSKKRIRIVESMLDEETAQQEVYGRQTGGTAEYPFREKLQETKHLPPYLFTERVQILHAFIDPCAGGSRSDYVVGTVAYEKGLFVLAGLDLTEYVGTNRNWDAAHVMIVLHVEQLLTKYPHAHLFVHIEANLNFLNAGQIGHFLTNHWIHTNPLLQRRIHILGKQFIDPDQEAMGEWTTNESKARWCMDFNFILQRKDFRLAHELISQQPDLVVKRLFEQLFFFGCHVVKSLDPRKTEAIILYSGKTGGRKDDCAVVVQAAVSEYLRSRTDPKYLKEYESMQALNF